MKELYRSGETALYAADAQRIGLVCYESDTRGCRFTYKDGWDRLGSRFFVQSGSPSFRCAPAKAHRELLTAPPGQWAMLWSVLSGKPNAYCRLIGSTDVFAAREELERWLSPRAAASPAPPREEPAAPLFAQPECAVCTHAPLRLEYPAFSRRFPLRLPSPFARLPVHAVQAGSLCLFEGEGGAFGAQQTLWGCSAVHPALRPSALPLSALGQDGMVYWCQLEENNNPDASI
ncbi:MAG: hypothetical protein PHD32_12385 [Eubacteriales bacterium]|nr:hypothetical protein [Eubacteriales bacterium]